jgi:hypothetical protein
VALLFCICLAAPARGATPAVSLKAALLREGHNREATIQFDIAIEPAPGQYPAALRGINLRYPEDLGVATSGLGLSTCSDATLRAEGPAGCPPDSVMGYGTSVAEVPFGSEVVYETAHTTTFMAPLSGGDLSLLFYVDGEEPVSVQLVFPGVVLPAAAPFGGDLTATLPLIASFPEAPDVAVLDFVTTLGPNRITYYEYAKHRRIPYHPRGILLPARCPHGGFPFSATLTFDDGSEARAGTVLPCYPTHRARD